MTKFRARSSLLRCCGAGLVAFATIGAAPVPGVNLIPNSSFDVDLSGWTVTDEARWVNEDAQSRSGSGSLEITTAKSAFDPMSALVCVPVTGGWYYRVGATIKMPVEDGDLGYPGFNVGFFLDDECKIDAEWGSSVGASALDWWLPIATRERAPTRAASAMIDLAAIKFEGDSESPVRASFDDVFFVAEAPGPSCADPSAPFFRITATDALLILRAAVGSGQCALCYCDVDDSGTLTTSDALAVLRFAIFDGIFTFTCTYCAAA